MVKGWSGDLIIQSIHHVHAGGGAFTPEVGLSLAKLVTVRNSSSPAPRFFNLSKREREVVCELVQGKDCQRIADALKIEYFTVNHHFKSIYRKLEVNSMGEAIRVARDHKLCP